LVFEVKNMPETKMLDKRNMNENDPNKMKDEITESGQDMAGKEANLAEEKIADIKGDEGSTCSGRDPYVPKNPVRKESEK
jgi:hypothetical protein